MDEETGCPTCMRPGMGREEAQDEKHNCVYKTKLKVLAKRFRLLQATLEKQHEIIEKQRLKLEGRKRGIEQVIKNYAFESCKRLDQERKTKAESNASHVPEVAEETRQKVMEKGQIELSSLPADKKDKKTIKEIQLSHSKMESISSSVSREKEQDLPSKIQPKTHQVVPPTKKVEDKPLPNQPKTMPKPNTKSSVPYKYIEVVRKRDERAVLPGHACEECAKYYDALGEEFKGQQDMCSRHRAAWEPYCTPEDFWRLSFPESEANQ